MPNLPNKVLWISVKTSSPDPCNGAVIQLGAVALNDNNALAEIEIHMAPFTGAWIDDKSLDMAGLSYSKIMDLQPLEEGMEQFLEFLNRYVNRFKRQDKFILAGKDMSRIDSQFLRNYFEYINNKYYGSYFFPLCLDIDFLLARMIMEKDLRLTRYSFENVCNYFDIPMPIYRPALEDAKLKQRLYRRLLSSLNEA